MKQDPICYLNGSYGRLSRLRFAPNDLGVLRGFGIFDFLRTYYGKPFLLEEHMTRFVRSAKRMGLTIPHSRTQLRNIVRTLLQRNKFPDTNIKFVLTGGVSADGFTLPPKPTFMVLAGRSVNLPHSFYTRGVKLQTHEYMRPIPEVKTLNYIESVRYQRELKKKKIFEFLYVFGGTVLECSSANIFIVKGNRLSTPKKHILIGTTRNFVLGLAKGLLRTEERDIKVSELFSADEVFLTASNKAVLPIVAIDRRKIGNGRPGPKTKILLARYLEALARL